MPLLSFKKLYYYNHTVNCFINHFQHMYSCSEIMPYTLFIHYLTDTYSRFYNKIDHSSENRKNKNRVYYKITNLNILVEVKVFGS